MSSASKQHPEEAPVGHNRHRIFWGAVAVIVLISFFSVWVLNNYGTPAKKGMPVPVVPPVTTVPGG